MKLGEKIKAERKRLGLTQNAIAGDHITRNMLSAIESGKVHPSLETLRYLSSTLGLPIGYLLDDEADLFFYKKEKSITAIRKAFADKKYKICLSMIEALGDTDDEICYIKVCASFFLGKQMTIAGDLSRAAHCFETCLSCMDACIYPTEEFRTLIPLYSAIIRNVQSPLLELDAEAFENAFFSSYDYEFYHYLNLDFDYKYTNRVFKLHMQAKALMRSRKYTEAISILEQLEDMKGPDEYNSCVILGVYTDLENSYKEMINFEKAYRYATKRISLLEGFRT
ncbi:MAG: helix-turn-helix transcriptional regulator [Clostridia bacterium]|nr:helix-turn-helix transcriptional regulator [Clostridia bacterium]